MKVIVLGASGQLGLSLSKMQSALSGEIIFLARSEIDISSFQVVTEIINSYSPDVVVNATAYTKVDLAEDDPNASDLVNNQAVMHLAAVCQDVGAWLLHVSTDYVFDGESVKPYAIRDIPRPQGVYGRTKLAGEIAIRARLRKHIIVRTSWLFSEFGMNFFTTMLRLGRERESVSVVDDQIGCPTYAPDLAMFLFNIIKRLEREEVSAGTHHYSGEEPCSWYDFACQIFILAEKAGFSVPEEITPVPSKNYPTVAKRPKYSVLDCSTTIRIFKEKPSDWRRGIIEALNAIPVVD